MLQPSVAQVAVLIQARLNSSRLPGKALLPLPLSASPESATVLAHVVRRAQRVPQAAIVIVATTDHPADDPLAAHAAALGAAVFRGDEADVLGRFAAAAQALAPACGTLVRLTADNPAVDPACISQALTYHLETQADYTLTTGLPLGTNVEIMSAASLTRAATEARDAAEREHVTPYLRRHPALFRLNTLRLAAAPGLAALRLTLDYPSDYALLSLLFSSLSLDFSLVELAAFVTRYSWLRAVNGSNVQQ